MSSSLVHPSDCPKCAICRCRCCINKRRQSSHVHELPRALIREDENRCRLILVRHGLSQDEMDQRYSGWNDGDISPVGQEQMHRTGQVLLQAHISIDLCFTSVLKRASKSLFIIQEEMDRLWVPVHSTWRLNDRMLGTLTGFRRDRAEALFGQNQLKEWLTRSDSSPPPLEESNPLHPRLHPVYRHISSIVPSTETLADIRQRLIPFFYDQLLRHLTVGRSILVVAHEDVLKGLVRLISDYAIDQFNDREIPIGRPMVYEFSPKTKAFLTGDYLLSPLFDEDTRHLMFPTGFSATQPRA